MTTTAKIIADSISEEGIRLTTFELRYPRIIHSEFMTHRVLSRNASSSRAIPIQRQIRDIIEDPAEPAEWGSAQKGMQAGKPLSGMRLKMTRAAWHGAKWGAIVAARIALRAGAHKQIANRMLEPWSHISVVATGTDWANFFALRDHEDADPTIQLLAATMKSSLSISTPRILSLGDWHLPYIREGERDEYDNRTLARFSAARCARVSYLTHDGKLPSRENDEKLWKQLVESKPVHASPTEHQATPDKLWTRNRWAKPEEHGNFRGYRQHRKMIPGEAVTD